MVKKYLPNGWMDEETHGLVSDESLSGWLVEVWAENLHLPHLYSMCLPGPSHLLTQLIGFKVSKLDMRLYRKHCISEAQPQRSTLRTQANFFCHWNSSAFMIQTYTYTHSREKLM